jgi:serine protease Do
MQTDPTQRMETETARKKVYPALVNISVVARFFSGGRTQRAPAGGSGVIVSPDGYVLTNFHVAGNTTRIACTLTTGEVIEAKVVLHDPLTDLSVLKLVLEKRTDPKIPIVYAALGDSDKVQIGDPVMSMGNPLMLSSSMTLGIVSNTKRVFTDFTGTQIEDQELELGEKTGVFTRWIQHDSLILPGNSGGPLVNGKGEVIGINELGGGGVGFAIPSNIAAQVLQGAMKGEMARAWLGVSVLPVNKIGRTQGTLLASLVANSPAAKAGLKPGDILLTLDEKEITTRFFEEIPVFYQRVSTLELGKEVSVRYLRGGQEAEVKVTPIKMERSLGREEELRQMGATIQEITEPMTRSRRLATKNGVLITGTRPGYPFEAAKPALSAGDILVAVGETATPSIEALRGALAKANKKEFVVTVRRRREEMICVVKVPEETPSNDGTELPKAWLGIRTQVMTPEIAKALKLNGTRGFRVTELYPTTSVAKSGLVVGDVITKVNNDVLNSFRPQDAEDLRRLIEDLNIGKMADLHIVRAGKPMKLTFKVEPQPAGSEQAKSARQKELEFSVRNLMPLDRMERRLGAEEKGVLVTEAIQGGWANIAGLELDDIIRSINGQIVDDVEMFERVMKGLLAEHPKTVQIFVKRGDRSHFVFIEPDWTKLSESE